MSNLTDKHQKVLTRSSSAYTVSKNKKDARVRVKRVRSISPRTLKEQSEDIQLIEKAGKKPLFNLKHNSRDK